MLNFEAGNVKKYFFYFLFFILYAHFYEYVDCPETSLNKILCLPNIQQKCAAKLGVSV